MFKNLKIGTKIIIGFIIITLMFFAVAYTGSSFIKNINKTFNELENSIVSGAITMIEVKVRIQEIRAQLFHYILVGDVKKICSERGETSTKKLILETGDSLKEFAEKHTEYESHLGGEEERIAEELEGRIERLNFAVVRIVNLKDQGIEKDKLLEEMNILFQPECNFLIDIVSQHEAIHMQELANANKNVSQKSAHADKIILVFIILILFLPAFIGVLISRSISNPVKKLQQGMKIVKKGNLNHKVRIDSKNEIGQLSRDFDKMTESLKKTRANIEKKVIERTMELEKMNERMTGRELKMIELKKEIARLKKEIKLISKK